MPPDPSNLLSNWRDRTNAALDTALQSLASAETASPLPAAMRHAVLFGGKRLRPLLVYASAHAAGSEPINWSALEAPAMAVELIHAYSLVHDDLPAMDNDVLRRGQPTVHVAFGEAQAIIVGDALQALAFQILAESMLPAAIQIKLIRELAYAAGVQGMCGGQALDMATHGKSTSLATLQHLHAMKTGALLRAAVQLGTITAGADEQLRIALDSYATALGMAFQIRDDLLDIEGDSATLGKTVGKDAAQDKATFPAQMGVATSYRHLDTLASTMRSALDGLPLPRRAPLDALAQQAIIRNH